MSADNTEWVHQLYLKNAPRLFKIARYRLHDPDKAKDMVQSVFLRLLSKADSVRGHENPDAWLTVTLGYVIQHEKNRRENQMLPLEVLEYEGIAADTPDSIDEVLPKQLSDDDKRLLKMFYEDKMSYAEISTVLGIPPSTCGSHLLRAKKRCKKLLEE